jgi:acyl dehydratase
VSAAATIDETRPGATRAQLAAFSAGTEDPNPIHVDEAFAQRSGFATVLQQGPMTTAHFALLLAQRFGQERLRSLDITFTAPVYPGEALRFVATVRPTAPASELDLVVSKADGTVTAKGVAVIAP